MRRMQSKICSLLLVLAIWISCSFQAAADVSEQNLQDAVQSSAAYMLETVKEPQINSIGGEWAVLGLARSGYEVPQEYWDNYYTGVKEYVKSCGGVLHDKKYTEYSRVVLALTAIGANPADVAGFNLLTPLGDFDKTIWQGLNGSVWALIALDSGNYDIPVNQNAKTQATRQMYIDEILSCQLSDGGWSLSGEGKDEPSEPDITGMVLQALSKYREQEPVKTAIRKALDCLSAQQDADGGYSGWGESNLESVVQVIVGLGELNIDVKDERFVKNGKSLLDTLMSFRQNDGSFAHSKDANDNNQMASEQGLYGMVAALRAAEGKSSLYRMNDVTIQVNENIPALPGLPDKHADVREMPISAPGMTFSDISGHANRKAIESLASRGIINGMGGGLFRPDTTMTRAEFAAIIVKGLGLPLKDDNPFQDVAETDWFFPYVNTAYAYGIVSGISDTEFAPKSTITRQEAAVMTARAAKLCGMDTAMDSVEIRNMLAQFGDYVTVADWAQQAMAFCYREDILDRNDLNIEPFRKILRCEIAQMVYQMLDSAKLLRG